MKYFIITSSGGGGHITAAKAEKERLKKMDPNTTIEVVDLMGVDTNITTENYKKKSWIPTYGIPLTNITFFSGHTNVEWWDALQKKGGLDSVRDLERLIDYQSFAESIQSSTVYQHLKSVVQENPDLEEIIDTQALSTPDICHAVAEENRRRALLTPPGKSIVVRKCVSEFLTDKAVHFLAPLSRVKQEDASCLTVESVNTPLKSNMETDAQFFERKHVDHIHFVKVPAPLRPAFRDGVYGREKTVYIKAVNLTTTPTANLERKLMDEQPFIVESLGDMGELHDKEHFKISKKEQDKFFTISLGSQGSITILRYIDTFIDQVLHADIHPESRVMLFIASGKNDGTSSTLYAMIRRHLEKRKADLEAVGIKWPDAAKIIPLSFQDDISMSSLFQNSDVLITRTGGMSSIEANETQALNPTRKVFLHSEAAPKHPEAFPRDQFDACYKCLMPGTVRWEGGNAQYLMQSIDACLASPETVLFNIDGRAHIPTFKQSIVQMAGAGELNQSHFNAIKTCLQRGSDPNLESLSGLPLLAHAQDMSTLRQCIRFGGELTPVIREHLLSHGFNHEAIQTLHALEKQVAEEIKQHGAPLYAIRAFKGAIYSGDLDIVKGMIYRYPHLISMKLAPKNGAEPLPLEDIAKQLHHLDIQALIVRIKGMGPLHLAMEEASINGINDREALKLIIFFHQQELNKEYKSRITPLTICKDKELRQLMVSFGAKPYYLDKSIPAEEQKELKKLYQDSEIAYNDLRFFIMKIYKEHKNHEDGFCRALSQHLEQFFDCKPNFSQMVAKSAFMDLKLTHTEIGNMSVLNKIINKIKQYLFGTDVLSRQTQMQSRKFMFYKATDKSLSREGSALAPSEASDDDSMDYSPV